MHGDCVGVCMYGHRYSKNMDETGKVVNPARGQLKRENKYFPVRLRASEFALPRRVRQSRPPSACSSPCSGLNLVLTYGIPPEFRGGVKYNGGFLPEIILLTLCYTIAIGEAN